MGQPFNVELPETFGSDASASEATPDTAHEATDKPAAETAAQETKPETNEPQITDLDSLERFRFQGRELSKDDLQKLLTGATDAKPESEHAKFDLNFRFDLAAVLESPSLLAKFRQIYPPEYVQLAERALKAQGVQPAQDASKATTDAKPADPRFEEVYQIAQEWKSAQREQRVSEIKSALDSSFEKLGKKYPDADPEVINSRLFAMRQQGVELRTKEGKLREDVIEKLFKEDHAKREAAYEAKYRQKVDAQKRANNQARDVGKGGSASSPPPVKPRTIKEATAAALASLE